MFDNFGNNSFERQANCSRNLITLVNLPYFIAHTDSMYRITEDLFPRIRKQTHLISNKTDVT